MIAAALLLLAMPQDIVVRAPAKPSAQTPATMVIEPVAMLIATFDSDGDGETSRIETEEGVRRTFDAIDTGRTGSLRYIAFADWAQKWLGDRNALPSPFDVDRNADGQVTLDELQDQFSRLFARFDRDRDGGITRAEVLTFRITPVDANGPTPPPGGKPAKGGKPR